MDTEGTPPPSPEVTAGTVKKYIRTFAGDMAILKEGGTPDLAPLAEPTPEERLIAPSPLNPAEAGSGEFRQDGILSEPTPLPEPKPAEPTPIETYSSDFSDKVKEEHASPMTVLAAEQDAEKEKIETSEPGKHSRGSILYVFAGVILLAAGGSGVYFAYTKYATSLAPMILAPTISAPIFVDDREQISGVGATLLRAIEQSVTRTLAPNTVRFLYTTSATSTDNSIFSSIQVPAPDILLRNINAAGSMAGIVNVAGVQSPFFILSVASYSDTFSGMLKWESTMPSDLSGLFPPYVTPTINIPIATSTMATTTATTTPKIAATTPKIINKVPTTAAGFRDEVVDNHDTRIYLDSYGRSILLYGYWNQTTLIIARDANAFTEIINRLATSQSQQ
jgi:hypothetical protein